MYLIEHFVIVLYTNCVYAIWGIKQTTHISTNLTVYCIESYTQFGYVQYIFSSLALG